MLATDRQGIPLTVLLSSASTSEFNLLFPTLNTLCVEKRPYHPIKKPHALVADRGYDAKWIREKLRRRGITPFIPKRRKAGQKEEPAYNKRVKAMYRTRWIVERTFSWIGNFRRTLIRWEKHLSTYQGFIHIACIMLCLRWVLK